MELLTVRSKPVFFAEQAGQSSASRISVLVLVVITIGELVQDAVAVDFRELLPSIHLCEPVLLPGNFDDKFVWQLSLPSVVEVTLGRLVDVDIAHHSAQRAV